MVEFPWVLNRWLDWWRGGLSFAARLIILNKFCAFDGLKNIDKKEKI